MSTLLYTGETLAHIAAILHVPIADVHKVHLGNLAEYRATYPHHAPPEPHTALYLETARDALPPEKLTGEWLADLFALLGLLRYNIETSGCEREITRIEASAFHALRRLHDPAFGPESFQQELRELRRARYFAALDAQAARERRHAAALPRPTVRTTGALMTSFGGLVPGDFCTESFVHEMRGALPPASNEPGYLQMGEEVRHTAAGATFHTWQRHGERWIYVGDLPQGVRAEIVGNV